MTALLLAAVDRAGGETGIALTADSFVAVEGLGEGSKGRIVNSATKTEDKVQGALLLDIVVAQCPAILKLLSGKDKTLLIRGDSLLVLDFLLDIVDGVRGLDIKGDGLTRKGLDEDLHDYIYSMGEREGTVSVSA